MDDSTKTSVKSWERQKGESEIQYMCFCVYRDLGPYRSLRAAAQQLGKSEILMQTYSQKHKWMMRAKLWADELDKKKREAVVKEVQEMAKRHINQSIAFQRVLVLPVEAIMKKINNDPDGKHRSFNGANMDKLFDKALKAAQTFSEVVKVERVSRGEPLDISKAAVDHTTGGEKIHVILPPINHKQDNEDDQTDEV